MEDDVLLSRHTRPAIETVIASGLIDDYDLLFTETFIPPLARELGRLKALYDRQVASAPGPGERRLNLAVVEYFHATSSYIANKNAIGRVVAVLDRAVAEGAKMPVDFLIRDAYLKQTLKVGCLFPFVTAVQFDWTGEQTITGRRRDARTAAALALARRSFFVDANIAELSALADKLIVPSGDPHARLLGQVLALHADPRASTNVPDQS
jgi:GR25 family glycosyltransferase involved in LPS biosynthesis